jgi:hypothetical protein
VDCDDAHAADVADPRARPRVAGGHACGLARRRARRWEHDGQRYFDGEVEPCINGRTIDTGAYFGQDVSGIVERILHERLADGGGTARPSTARCAPPRHHDQRARRPARVRAGGRRRRLRCGPPAAAARSTCWPGAVPTPEHGRGRDPAYSTSRSRTTWHYDVLRALDHFRRAGPALNRGWPRPSRSYGPSAARRPRHARPHPPGARAPRPRGGRRTQPLDTRCGPWVCWSGGIARRPRRDRSVRRNRPDRATPDGQDARGSRTGHVVHRRGPPAPPVGS